MVRVLRDDGDAVGLVTAISGMITKQAVVLLGTRPPGPPYRAVDVSDEVAAATARRSYVPTVSGTAEVATYTVLHSRGGPAQGVVVCDVDGGDGDGVAGRTIATTTDPGVMGAMTETELCGRRVLLAGDGTFRPA